MQQIALTAGLAASALMSRTIKIENHCYYTVWPAVYPAVDGKGGWIMGVHSEPVLYHVPDDWDGRIWGRVSCTYDDKDQLQCLDGACPGGENCTGPGTESTLAQFTLNPSGPDTYAVSIVDAFNVELNIDNDKGCKQVGCDYDLLENCPADQSVPDEQGYTILCNQCSAAGLGGSFRGYGCDASWFEHCPHANAHRDDQRGSGTCENDATYTVTFCPPHGPK